MSFTIEWNGQGVHIHYQGVINHQDVVDAYQAVNNDPRFDSLRYQILDYSKVTDIRYSIEEIFKYAHLEKASSLSNQRMKMAQVGGPEEAQALASLYQSETHTSPWEFELFDSLDEAKQWAADC